MLTQQDQQFLASKHISEEQLNEQLHIFETGVPFLKLSAAAAVGKGILVADPQAADTYTQAWEQYLGGNHTVLKFVPASGAASRMFKALFEFLDSDSDTPDNDFITRFFDNIDHFAFYDALNDSCVVNHGQTIEDLVAQKEYKAVVECLLGEEGLDYGHLPKGLLQFHAYTDSVRTPLEEHLVEGAMYAQTADHKVNIHFTVSPEHRQLFQALVDARVREYEQMFGVKYNITFSEQKPSTDTVAATADNQPFRTADGQLLFRPGGHGALIENLNDLDADIIFIKNIDNVVPDSLKPSTVSNKKLLAGILVDTQKRIHQYLNELDAPHVSHEKLVEISQFLHDTLCITNPDIDTLDDAALAAYLRGKLNRPIRACGMVKNVGEPGGGPFLAYNPDGTISPQILESVQIDTSNDEYQKMFKQGTHFNPVDLVCAVKDYKGQAFDLTRYVDPQTAFISHKSKDGKELKALERPGLWNGAMSDWNTLFVEVPLDTFNPVKTVNDLLRQQHQA